MSKERKASDAVIAFLPTQGPPGRLVVTGIRRCHRRANPPCSSTTTTTSMQSVFRINTDPQSSMATPDSPGEPPQSPPPPGVQGDVELELIGLANALYNLGTTVVNDLSKERQQAPNGDAPPAKPVGQRVNDVIGHLATIEEMSASIPTMIPFQTLQCVACY